LKELFALLLLLNSFWLLGFLVDQMFSWLQKIVVPNDKLIHSTPEMKCADAPVALQLAIRPLPDVDSVFGVGVEGQVMATAASRDAPERSVSQCCSVTFADWFLSSSVQIWGNSLFRSMYSVLFKCNSDLLSMLKYARRRPTNIGCIVTAPIVQIAQSHTHTRIDYRV
jgi:hypothetical protein